MNHPTDPPVVYLIVRQSPDCSPRMVEVMGACMTLADADALRDDIFKRRGWRCHIEWLHPLPPSEGSENGK